MELVLPVFSRLCRVKIMKVKLQGNTIVLIPSENLNSSGVGNLAMSIAYLESTKKAVESNTNAASTKKAAPDIINDGNSKFK
jgi:hypothetical protein